MVTQKEITTPAGYLPVAVYWSGGSLAPPESGIQVDPPPYLYAVAVSMAVRLTAVSVPFAQIPAAYQSCLASGVHVAEHPMCWKRPN